MSLVTMTRRESVSDELQFKLLRAAVFPFFLGAATLGRALRPGRPGVARSILAEARAASASALTFAFQG